MIWPHATKVNPCPICNGVDWCTFGQRAMLCQRVESDKPSTKGGWYHFYGDNQASRPLVLPKAKLAPAHIDAERIINKLRDSTYRIDTFAQILGVSLESLERLNTAWDNSHKALAFPMSDGAGRHIGIRLRNNDGFKWAITGSRQGIFLPQQSVTNGNARWIAYLPEGPTDTAAMLTMGLFAIGRPSCNGGNEQIKEALKRLRIGRVVVVADNDGIKTGGRRPGLEGAIKLKKFLGLPSVIWMPPSPIKDVREFLNKGGTAQMIEAEIKNKVWNRL